MLGHSSLAEPSRRECSWRHCRAAHGRPATAPCLDVNLQPACTRGRCPCSSQVVTFSMGAAAERSAHVAALLALTTAAFLADMAWWLRCRKCAAGARQFAGRGRTCCGAPFSAVASAAHPAGTWAPPSAACPPFPSHAVGQHLAAAVTHAGGTCCRCSSARTTCYWAPGGRWCCGRARCLRTPSTAAAAGWRRHSTCSWCCTVGMCLPA